MAGNENDPLFNQTGLTAGERRLRASVAGFASWARTDDRQARLEKAQRLSPRDWEWHANLLDPNNELLPEVRYQRGEAARLQYFKRLALASATKRRKRRTHNGA